MCGEVFEQVPFNVLDRNNFLTCWCFPRVEFWQNSMSWLWKKDLFCFKRCWHILVEYWALVELWLYELARTWLKLSWVWCPCPLYQFIMSSSWCNYHVRDGPLNYICQHSLNISKIMQKTFCKYYVTGSAPASISWCGTFYFLRYLQCFSKNIYLCSFMFSCITVSL